MPFHSEGTFAAPTSLVFCRRSRMTGILIEYARFVDVQQRRARIIAELGHPNETPAPRAPLAASDESTEVGERTAPAVDIKTRLAVDG